MDTVNPLQVRGAVALRLSEPQSQRTVFPGLVALGGSPMSGGLDRKYQKSNLQLQLQLLSRTPAVPGM